MVAAFKKNPVFFSVAFGLAVLLVLSYVLIYREQGRFYYFRLALMLAAIGACFFEFLRKNSTRT